MSCVVVLGSSHCTAQQLQQHKRGDYTNVVLDRERLRFFVAFAGEGRPCCCAPRRGTSCSGSCPNQPPPGCGTVRPPPGSPAPTSPGPDMAGDVIACRLRPRLSTLAGASTGHRRWCRHGESGPAAEGCHPRLVDAEVNHGRGSDGCSQLGHPGPAQTSGVSTLRLQTVVSSANRVEGNAMRAQGCGRLLGGCFTC